jgi:serine/threonine protein kinase
MKRFETSTILGDGAHGVVVKAKRKSDNLEGVLKSIKKLKHFRNERDVLAKIPSHPGIVKLYESFEDKKKGHLFLEYIGGEILLDQSYELQYVISYIRQIALILQHIHANGFVYADLKPDNLIESNEVIKLVDFGLTEPIGASIDLVGTIYYMPPEMIKLEGTFQPAIDAWALGALTYELAFDEPPFEYEDSESESDTVDTVDDKDKADTVNDKQDETNKDMDKDASGSDEEDDLDDDSEDGSDEEDDKPGKQEDKQGSNQEDPDTDAVDTVDNLDGHFDDKDRALLERIKECNYTIPSTYDNPYIADFITKLLNPDPQKRMSIDDALKHPFLN